MKVFPSTLLRLRLTLSNLLKVMYDYCTYVTGATSVPIENFEVHKNT